MTKVYKLKEITHVIICGVTKRPQYVEEGYMFLSSQHVKQGKVILEDHKYISEADYIKWTKKNKPEQGDLLYTRVGSVGEAAVIETEEPFAIYVSLTLIKPKKDRVHNRYLMHYLNAPMFRGLAKASTRGIGVQNLNVNTVREFEIVLPDLSVQKQMADVLDNAHRLIEKRKQQIEACEELMKAQFIKMFGTVKNNTKGYETKKIGEIADIVTGATPSRGKAEYYGGDIPWIKTGEISKQYITEAEEYITEKALQKTNCRLLPINSVMIAMYGQGKTRGQAGLLRIKAATNQACAAILPNRYYNAVFLYKQLDLLYEELRRLGHGGNQTNLNLSMLKNFKVLVPPIALQDQYAQFAQKVDGLKFKMEQSLCELENNFNTLRNRLLKESE